MFSALPTLFWQDLAWVELALILSDWVIRIVMLVVVPQRRDPASARSWLTLIFLLPWLGLLFYFLLGRPRVAEYRRERHIAYQLRIQELPQSDLARRGTQGVSRTTTSPTPAPGSVSHSAKESIEATSAASDGFDEPLRTSRAERLQPTATLAQALSTLPILGGNAATLLDDYEGTIDQLLADIDNASQHVHILYYIFADDAPGPAQVAATDAGGWCRSHCHSPS